jgi:PAS domain S-box-containing protein
MRRSIYLSVLLALLLPPFLGGSIMGLVGFYPLPEFYLVFFSYSGVYVLAILISVLALVPRVYRFIVNLTQQKPARAAMIAQRVFTRMPWYLLLFITLYSTGGVLSADFSLESIGVRNYTLREHIYNLFGLVPVVLITAVPIFFYFIDRLGRYLGPRSIAAIATPFWAKLLMLGLLTPLLIDSLLLGYYYNHTRFFSIETLALWISLLALAAGGTWLAWLSLRQGMAPLESFIESQFNLSTENGNSRLTSLSLDELGILTTRFAKLVATQNQLTTSLQSAESLANAVIDHAGGLVVVLDRDGHIVRFNHACEEISGYTFEQVCGKFPWDNLLPAENAEKIRLEAFEALTNQPQALTGHYTNYWFNKRGEKRLIEWSNTLLKDANGQMQYMVSLGNDVTLRHEYENKLKRLNETLESRVEQRTSALKFARDMAENANAAKSEFLSRMSHELRTPLNAILGFGQLLEIGDGQPLSASQADNVGEILHAGNHLLELINEILELTRIESGHLDIHPVAIPILSMIDACTRHIQPLAAQRRIRIVIEPNNDFAVLGDLMRLREVLNNLLTNAIKYNRDGGEIHISFTPVAEQRIRICVRDTGHGIASEFLPRLFKPFEQLESAYEGIDGTGIGLALAKRLVEAMHGIIGVESVPGSGSTFWFELPVAIADTSITENDRHNSTPSGLIKNSNFEY